MGKAQFSGDKFNEYVEMEEAFGLSVNEYSIFGDRAPPGYTKIRLFSKLGNTVHWLF